MHPWHWDADSNSSPTASPAVAAYGGWAIVCSGTLAACKQLDSFNARKWQDIRWQ